MLFSERRRKDRIQRKLAEWDAAIRKSPINALVDLSNPKREIVDAILDQAGERLIIVPYFFTENDGQKRPTDPAAFVAVGINPTTFWMSWNDYLEALEKDTGDDNPIAQDMRDGTPGLKKTLEDRFGVKLEDRA